MDLHEALEKAAAHFGREAERAEYAEHDERATECRAIAAALRGAMEWQPMEEAPRDGTEFQSFVRHNHTQRVFWEPRCIYDDDGRFCLWTRIDYDEDGWDERPDLTPVSWQPHPLPPSAS